MDLTTRCPHCGTTFAATFAQLQLRKGYIRCVQCANIFDGYEAVVSSTGFAENDGLETTPSSSASTHTSTVAPVLQVAASVPREPASVPPASVLSATSEPQHTVSPAPVVPSDPAGRRGAFTISEHLLQPGAGMREPAFRIGAGSSSGAAASSVPETGDPSVIRRRRVDVDDPEDLQDALHAEARPGIYVEPKHAGSGSAYDGPRFMKEPRSAAQIALGLFWGGLVVLGLALLVLQLAYVYRAQLANNVPSLRAPLTLLCQELRCQVPYMRDIDNIRIVSSSLRTDQTAGGTAGGGDSMVTLLVALRNTLDKPQEWPTLVLSLTDFSGTLIARRNLPPASYLSPEQRRQPFPAGAEADIRLPLSLQGLKVNGYKLDKHFQ